MRAFFLNSVVIFFLWFTLPVCAQEVSVSAKTDKQAYLIGDYIRLQVLVTQTGNVSIKFTEADSLAPFDRITASPVDTFSAGNTIQYKQEIVYSIYDAGYYTIDPVKVVYKKQDDANYFLAETDTIHFVVNSVAVDTTQAIKPIKDVMHVTVKNNLWVYILAGIGALGIILLAIYLFSKSRKKKTLPAATTPSISLYDATKQKLQELEEKKLWQHNNTKQYYIELTDITRTYIEKRYNLPAMENTSDEIIESLVRMGVAAEQVHHMHTVLQYADLAKFAKSRPLAAENTLAMQYVNEFVETTQINKPEAK